MFNKNHTQSPIYMSINLHLTISWHSSSFFVSSPHRRPNPVWLQLLVGQNCLKRTTCMTRSGPIPRLNCKDEVRHKIILPLFRMNIWRHVMNVMIIIPPRILPLVLAWSWWISHMNWVSTSSLSYSSFYCQMSETQPSHRWYLALAIGLSRSVKYHHPPSTHSASLSSPSPL